MIRFIEYAYYYARGGWVLGILLLRSNSIQKEILQEDYCSFVKYEEPYSVFGASRLLCKKPSYRNVVFYRIKTWEVGYLFTKLFRIVYKPLDTIEIGGNIGGGFRINHNYAVIFPQTAGKNLVVQQGAVIGGDRKSEGNKKPILGDNVYVGSNAVVLGNIHVGNNVKIGALAFVNHDLPDNCTAVGNPCRIIKKSETR